MLLLKRIELPSYTKLVQSECSNYNILCNFTILAII